MLACVDWTEISASKLIQYTVSVAKQVGRKGVAEPSIYILAIPVRDFIYIILIINKISLSNRY
jgi:hypothetical protein